MYYDHMTGRAFQFDLSNPETEYPVPQDGPGSTFMQLVQKCKDNGNRTFVDDEMEDGSIAHSFARIIGENPVNGNVLRDIDAQGVFFITRFIEANKVEQIPGMRPTR